MELVEVVCRSNMALDTVASRTNVGLGGDVFRSNRSQTQRGVRRGRV